MTTATLKNMTTTDLMSLKDSLHSFLATPASRNNDAAAIAQIAAIKKEHKSRMKAAGVPRRFYS